MFDFFIIEDQQMMREMLAEFISKTMPGYHLKGHTADAEEGLALCQQLKPHLVLIDIHLPKADGIEIAKTLTINLPETHVILISGDCSLYTCHRISESGIRGFVDKARPLTELQEAIRKIMDGGVWFSPSFENARRNNGENPDAFFKILSAREQEVLVRVACGDNDDDIARNLNISRRTAETHRYNISRKLNLGDKMTLRRYALQQGVWHPDMQGTYP